MQDNPLATRLRRSTARTMMRRNQLLVTYRTPALSMRQGLREQENDLIDDGLSLQNM